VLPSAACPRPTTLHLSSTLHCLRTAGHPWTGMFSNTSAPVPRGQASLLPPCPLQVVSNSIMSLTLKMKGGLRLLCQPLASVATALGGVNHCPCPAYGHPIPFAHTMAPRSSSPTARASAIAMPVGWYPALPPSANTASQAFATLPQAQQLPHHHHPMALPLRKPLVQPSGAPGGGTGGVLLCRGVRAGDVAGEPVMVGLQAHPLTGLLADAGDADSSTPTYHDCPGSTDMMGLHTQVEGADEVNSAMPVMAAAAARTPQPPHVQQLQDLVASARRAQLGLAVGHPVTQHLMGIHWG
jgi:hypothetical protein